jgi:hypothetical protein
MIIRILAFLAARERKFRLREHFLSCSGQIKQRNEGTQRERERAERMVDGLRKEEEKIYNAKDGDRKKEKKYSHLKYTYSKPLNVRRDVNHTN